MDPSKESNDQQRVSDPGFRAEPAPSTAHSTRPGEPDQRRTDHAATVVHPAPDAAEVPTAGGAEGVPPAATGRQVTLVSQGAPAGTLRTERTEKEVSVDPIEISEPLTPEQQAEREAQPKPARRVRPKAEREQAVHALCTLLVAGTPPMRAVMALMQTSGVPFSTARKDLRRARARLALIGLIGEQERDCERAILLAKVQETYETAKDAGDWEGMLAAISWQARLAGLAVADARGGLTIGTPGGQSLTVNFIQEIAREVAASDQDEREWKRQQLELARQQLAHPPTDGPTGENGTANGVH